MSIKISIIAIGEHPIQLINYLLQYKGIQLNIIPMNLLDYKLPPIHENAAPQAHRHELRHILQQLGIYESIAISSSLMDLIKSNDRLDLGDIELTISSHIDQIETNSHDLATAYKNLLKETNLENVSLYPLSESNLELYSFKNKKYAPLRYYYSTGKLLDEPFEDNGKKKRSEKKLSIENLEELKDVKLNDDALKALSESEIILMVATDIISLSITSQIKEIAKQFEKIDNPIVFLSYLNQPNEVEKEITSLIGTGTQISDFSKYLSDRTDYVLIDKSDKENADILRESGCRVIIEDLSPEAADLENNSLLRTIYRIGDIAIDSVSQELIKTEDEEVETSDKNSKIPNDKKSSAKPISQFLESPAEAGATKALESVGDNSSTLITEEETSTIAEPNSENEKITIPESIGGEEESFKILEEEEWFDAASRAIEISISNIDDIAFTWLKKQSAIDSEKEIQIAEKLISIWIESRSVIKRKQGAELISDISTGHKETYIQILERKMISAVTNMQEDQRRILVPLILILNDVDDVLGSEIIGNLTRKLSILKDDNNKSITEIAKLTVLQLVIHSKRLIKIATSELLQIFVSKTNIGPEIWNILIAFDAGIVGLELVTKFSIDKAEEILRRASLLRFTGTYYSILTRIIQSMKEGDKTALSLITGAIIPEETLRKLERLQLATKVKKLKMVQLSTLAESIGKDVKYVERLITELIVNDELKAEIKLIEENMYLVATDDENTS